MFKNCASLLFSSLLFLSCEKEDPAIAEEKFTFPSTFEIDRVAKSVPEVYTKDGKLSGVKGKIDKTTHFTKSNPAGIESIKILSETQGEVYEINSFKQNVNVLITPGVIEMTPAPLISTYLYINPAVKAGSQEETNPAKVKEYATYKGVTDANRFNLGFYVIKYKRADVFTSVESQANYVDPDLFSKLGLQDTLVIMKYNVHFKVKK